MRRFLVGVYCWFFNYSVLALGPVLMFLLVFNILYQTPIPTKLWAIGFIGTLIATILYQVFRAKATWMSPGERILGNIDKKNILGNYSPLTNRRRWPFFIAATLTGSLLSNWFDNLMYTVYPVFPSSIFVVLLVAVYKKVLSFSKTFEWITALQIAVFIFAAGIFFLKGRDSSASFYFLYLPPSVCWIIIAIYYSNRKMINE